MTPLQEAIVKEFENNMLCNQQDTDNPLVGE
jgi:hypothetical protein